MKKTILLLALMVGMGKVSAQATDMPHPRGYVCYATKKPIKVDGNIDNKEWRDAPWTDLFVDIEGDKKPKPRLNTRAKMLWDKDYFYIAAELEEPDLWGTLTRRDAVIYYDNDFEIFIDPNGDNMMYYELELNALNTLWDLLLIKPYRSGGPAIDSWDVQGVKTAVKLYGTLNDNTDTDEKWTIEFALPWSVLEEANGNRKPKAGDQWRLGFSRVQWDLDKVGKSYEKRKGANGKPLPEYNWVWSPQGVIAMHNPETWGYVQFSDIEVGKGTEEVRKDPDYGVKIELMKVYWKQRAYRDKYGEYTDNWDDLQMENKDNAMGLTANGNQFKASIMGTDQRWSIDQESKFTSKKYPTFWTWMSAGVDADFEHRFAVLDSMGIKGVVLQSSVEGYKKAIPIARQYGITVSAWQVIMNDGGITQKHPEWLDYNRNGDRLDKVKAYVDYYKFMNPSLPEVQEYLKEKLTKICQIDGLDGISLDYCRYVDVILPDDIQPNYNIVQDKEYPQWDYGYHPYSLAKFEKKYGYNPQKLEDPSKDEKWLQFRYDEITNIARMLGEVAHKHGKTISASPFPSPTIAKEYVRQDWGNWQLDYVYPMIYFPFYKKNADWVGELMKENTAIEGVGDNVYAGLICYASDHDASRERPPLATPVKIAFENGARGVCFFSEGSFKNKDVRAEITQLIKEYNEKNK